MLQQTQNNSLLAATGPRAKSLIELDARIRAEQVPVLVEQRMHIVLRISGAVLVLEELLDAPHPSLGTESDH